jgi:hypothetical protein
VGEKNVVCRVSDDEIRSHSHSHTDTDKAHGDCGLGGYGVWGDGSEGAIHNLGKARQQAGKSSVSVSVMDVQVIMPARQRFPGQAEEPKRATTGRVDSELDGTGSWRARSVGSCIRWFVSGGQQQSATRVPAKPHQ